MPDRPPGPAEPAAPVVLRIATGPHPRGPDSVSLGFEADDGTVQVLAELDGRHLSTQLTGGFTGRLLALYAVGGDAAFAWFDYHSDE